MAIDREATLKDAEKYLRVGRLDAAITEYARVVEDQPRDWTSANTLGDLYMRAKQPDRAVALYVRIADHLRTEGFYSKAAALYKKILKITPDDEDARLHLAEISVRQGLLADAKACFGAVANRRRQRDDLAGADEVIIRMAAIDPADLPARLAAARALERAGDMPGAALRYRELFDEFNEREREDDAAAALQDCVRCDPSMRDAEMLVPLAAIELHAGHLEPARALLAEALTLASSSRDRVIDLAWSLAGTDVEAAALCVDAVADAWIATGEFAEAAAILREFATRVPARIGTLLRLVEVSVDGGLESTMYEAQAQLADAYLAADRAEEARVIAEDLVTREPEEISHVERLRTALTMLGVEDVEGAVAARMSALPTDPVELFDDFPEFAEIATPSSIRSAEDLAPPAGEPTADVMEPAPTAPSAEVDLTTLLSDLEGQPVQLSAAAPARPAPDLEDVFATMRYEAAAGVEADESAEHLALARSYMELGQPDEAIGSLQIASRSPQYRFTAAAALGQIFRDQSDLPRAIEWLERAVEAPAPSADEGRAVLYDLGDVLEAIGETSRALAVFLELAADVPDFRDVGRRVTSLSSAEMEG
ncbi:MAG: tetratricopeptide repeat protein [Acidobacteriota bacterium]|nr:tetratricopeptide repeat protein [Acidobacteriota bacterium]